MLLAGAEGLEPPTAGFGDRCSTRLSYAPPQNRSCRKAGTRLPSIGRARWCGKGTLAGTAAALLRFPQVSPIIGPVEAGRPMGLEDALFVLIVALPLAFFPQSRDAFLDVKILLLAGAGS